MGLDTSHNAWHGPYSAFTYWREAIAKAAGYRVARLEGDLYNTTLIDWGHITEANLRGEWAETPADPLIVLIAHSDCDGVIHPAQAGPLADRLEELEPLIDYGDERMRMLYGHKTRQFINGLRAAVAAGEDVDFH